MNLVYVESGRINHGRDSGGVTEDTDLENGYYVHGDYGDGVIAGPFETESEAEDAMRDMEDL